MRPGSARAQRAFRLKVAASFVLVALFAVVGAVVWWQLSRSTPPGALLCPSGGPKAHVALLVDRTDPLTFTQAKAFNGLLASFALGKRTKEGELLSIFALGENFRQTAEPLFEKCNPGDGRDKSPLTDNPELWKKRFHEEYEQPIASLERELRAASPGAKSPIMEMLQLVALRFDKHGVNSQKRLVIVSDMLHNTPDVNMYVERPDFDQLIKRPAFQRLRAKLHGVEVEVFLLLNRPDLQNRGVIKFWEDYFKDAGAVLKRVDLVPG